MTIKLMVVVIDLCQHLPDSSTTCMPTDPSQFDPGKFGSKSFVSLASTGFCLLRNRNAISAVQHHGLQKVLASAFTVAETGRRKEKS
jgi:hypothetical protein